VFLVLPAHILLYTTLLKFSCTKNSIQHSIIVGPTTKMDTTNRIIAIVNEATWWCKGVHAKANKQKTISSNRIESNRNYLRIESNRFLLCRIAQHYHITYTVLEGMWNTAQSINQLHVSVLATTFLKLLCKLSLVNFFGYIMQSRGRRDCSLPPSELYALHSLTLLGLGL